MTSASWLDVVVNEYDDEADDDDDEDDDDDDVDNDDDDDDDIGRVDGYAHNMFRCYMDYKSFYKYVTSGTGLKVHYMHVHIR